MVDLSTTYMGLELDNPLVVASCGLTRNLEGIRRAAEAGAGAVVLGSLFEEQMKVESDELNSEMLEYAHTEAFDYVRAEIGMNLGASEYAKLIEMAKKAVSTPIIASVNCISPKWWVKYAKQIAEAGPDALELSISRMPIDEKNTSAGVEDIYYSIVEGVKRVVDIPIAVKVGPYVTSLSNVSAELVKRGASALVLFNRFYRFDIDIDAMRPASARPYSSEEELSWSLRWIALLSGRVPCDFAASTGIHDASGLIKQLLAGARVGQACSTFYLNGLDHIGNILSGLESWMKEHDIDSVADIPQNFSTDFTENPEVLERLQYIKYYAGMD